MNKNQVHLPGLILTLRVGDHVVYHHMSTKQTTSMEVKRIDGDRVRLCFLGFGKFLNFTLGPIIRGHDDHMIFDSHGSIVTTTIHKIMVHGQKIKVRIQAPDTIEFFRTDCRIRRIAG